VRTRVELQEALADLERPEAQAILNQITQFVAVIKGYAAILVPKAAGAQGPPRTIWGFLAPLSRSAGLISTGTASTGTWPSMSVGVMLMGMLGWPYLAASSEKTPTSRRGTSTPAVYGVPGGRSPPEV
jgi:hypothetical protein